MADQVIGQGSLPALIFFARFLEPSAVLTFRLGETENLLED